MMAVILMDLEWQQSWCRNLVTFWSSCKNRVSLSGSSRTMASSADMPRWSSSLRNSSECFRNSPKFRGCSTCCTMMSRPFNNSTVDSQRFSLPPRLSTLTWPLREWISTSHRPRKSKGKFALQKYTTLIKYIIGERSVFLLFEVWEGSQGFVLRV